MVDRNSDGSVTLPNGQKVNGFGEAKKNDDGGVRFESRGADGSLNIKSFDKNGNMQNQSWDKDGHKTSDYSINKDGSSAGFIEKDDGTVDKWDTPAGQHKYEDNIF